MLVAGGAAIELCWLGVIALDDLRAQLPAFVGLFGVAFLVYLAVTWYALAGRAAAPLGPILACAALFRLTLLAAPPTLSDDLYRSVWEGRVLLAGVSPYRAAPDAPELAHLRDGVWAALNNPSVPSPYPPLTQLYAVGTALISPTDVFGPKLLSTLIDCGIVLALLLWLRRRGRPDRAVLVYAWSPLPVLELAHSGHNDALMVLLLVLALAGERLRYLGAGLLALATLAKIAPIVVAPLLARRWGAGPLALFGVMVVLGYAPLLALGGGATGSLLAYATTWSDNDSLFFVLRLVLWPFAGDAVGPAKAASAALLLAGLAVLGIHPRARAWPAQRLALAALGLFLLLSSTVHAWYVVWLLPLLAHELTAADRPLVFEPTWAFGWLLFSGLVALPYLTYGDHVWQPWISVVEYGPLYGLLGVAAWRALATARRAEAATPWDLPVRAPAGLDG